MDHSESLPAAYAPSHSGKPHSRRGIHSASRQILWGKLEENLALLEIAAPQRSDTTDNDRESCIIEQCREKLAKARECIERVRPRPFLFWELIHQVDDLLLLVLPQDILSARAVEIQALFDSKIKDPELRKSWLGTDGERGPLLKTVQHLAEQTPAVEAPSSADRAILQGALRAVNRQVDKGFWQLSMNVAVQVLSASILVLLFLVAIFFAPHSPLQWDVLERLRGPLGSGEGLALSFILLGAGGALVSTMLSKERFIFSIGATNRYFVYYVLAKPALGAFAALVFYLLERSALVFQIIPRSSSGTPAAPEGLFQIVVGTPETKFFILAVLSVAAGFSAEKWLGGTMDKVLGRMLDRSEKTVPKSAVGTAEARKKAQEA